MASERFSLYMFQEDIDQIESWVLDYPDLETGGTLFGLWNNSSNPVAHLVLGPGQHCRRTAYSFFQDISYLERVGHTLTHDYMLCHIGEWHSHHRLGLYQPSGGDVSTVVRNFPTGVCAFLLMIVNIISVSKRKVKLSPYMFTGTSNYYHGNVVPVRGRSPFRCIRKISESIERGREVRNRARGRLPSPDRNLKQKMRGNSTKNTAEKRSQLLHTENAPTYSTPKPQRLLKGRNTYRDEDLYQQTPKGPSGVDVSKCTDPGQWYTTLRGQEQLKAIQENLVREHPDTRDFEMSRDSSTQNLVISFVHHRKSWTFEFPPNFPRVRPVLIRTVYAERQTPKPILPDARSTRESMIIPDMIRKHCNYCKQKKSRPTLWCR